MANESPSSTSSLHHSQTLTPAPKTGGRKGDFPRSSRTILPWNHRFVVRYYYWPRFTTSSHTAASPPLAPSPRRTTRHHVLFRIIFAVDIIDTTVVVQRWQFHRRRFGPRPPMARTHRHHRRHLLKQPRHRAYPKRPSSKGPDARSDRAMRSS